MAVKVKIPTPLRTLTNGVDVAEQRLEITFDLLDDAADTPGHHARGDDDADLRDGDRQRRHGNDAQEHVAPHH